MALWNVHRAAIQSEPAPARRASLAPSSTPLCASVAGVVSIRARKPEPWNWLAAKRSLPTLSDVRGTQNAPRSARHRQSRWRFGSVLQTLRVPLVKETFETNVAGVYIVGELSGMGLIKTAINEGRLAIDSIKTAVGDRGQVAAAARRTRPARAVPSRQDSDQRPTT